MIDKSPGMSKAASNRGQKAELVCRARGASDITFSWQKEGQQLATPTQLAQSTKYSVTAAKTDPLTWESRLTIESIGSQDYGEYKCVAGNVMGLDEHLILLNVKSQPDPPQDLQVVNVTYNSVFLTWQPGFNGGFPQSYRVRMKKAGSEHHFTVEVRPPDATVFQVQDLQMGSRYSFAVMAFNEMGESEYTTTSVLATTASESYLFTFHSAVPCKCMWLELGGGRGGGGILQTGMQI
jgi:Fibronectin type III domain/Immunoglobulin I-set domain